MLFFFLIELNNIIEEIAQCFSLQRFQVETSCTALHCKQPVFFTGNKMDRYMPEINIVLEQIQNSPSTSIRKFYIKCYSNWVVFINQVKYITEMSGHYYF